MTALLFDGFSGSISANVYRGIRLTASVALWFAKEKKDKQQQKSQFIAMNNRASPDLGDALFTRRTEWKTLFFITSGGAILLFFAAL